MKRIVYRGIGSEEAREVIHKQKYDRAEFRCFQKGIAAKSVFGSGIYLVSDIELAIQYAFCHAEAERKTGQAAILKQQLTMKNPLILNYRYTEKNLRKDAFEWKYHNDNFPDLKSKQGSLQLKEQMKNIIKEYVLFHHYDSIVYYVDDKLVYYVSYYPEQQISDIEINFHFNIKDLTRTRDNNSL
ncbi:hypothetical protein [Niallia sp. 01092]|uniref:hypothetical protein n=1 Tax=unclassified Niallia TaxID=2837522 RepID=UPI003FD658BB